MTTNLVRRAARAGLAVALFGGATLIALAGTPADASAGVPGTAPTLVQGATDLGPATGPFGLTLVLPLQDRAGLDQLLASLYQPSSPDYHRFLTPAAFDAQFAPSPATLASVEGWASSAGLSVVSVSANRTLVRVSGPASAVDRAFGVSLDQFRTPQGQTYVSNTTPAGIPAALAGDLAAVVGLSSLGQVSLAPVLAPSSSSASSGLAYPTSYDPQQFWSFYDAPAAHTGAGQTIAILAEGDLSQPKADLVTFEKTYGLPAVPWTTVPTGPASSDTSGNTEWDLDTQYSTGMAQDVSSLLVYDAPSLSNSDILNEMNTWVTDDQAQQADFSAGECELLADASGFLTANDQVLAQAVAQGQTLFTAAGDTGAFCPALVGVNGVPAGLPNVNYPASSPYAVGVGGTTILGGPAPLREIGWYAGGGGESLFEPAPADQAAVGGSSLGVTRGVPDVAFDADPESGFDVIVGGQPTVVGGTSGGGPSWLGIWARAQADHGGGLGFAGHTVYAEPASAFNDITVGDNGIYPCTPGYDYVTGRGTPDIAAFVADA